MVVPSGAISPKDRGEMLKNRFYDEGFTSESQAPGWLALAPNQVLVVISSIC